MDYRGEIIDWNDERGFGFIRPAGGGAELFFHVSDYGGAGRPAKGNSVTFGIGRGRDGKPAATRVQPAFAGARQTARPRLKTSQNHLRLWLAGLILGLALCVVLFGRAHVVLPLLYPGMGLAAFVLYALDKGAAQSGGWRIPESSLHLLDLAFGVAGGLIAQEMLRHKTAKQSFAIVSYAIAFAHIALLAAVLLGIDGIDSFVTGLI